MKSGLVLEGGGMRGIFTAGVLDFFLDKGIDFDICLGVSAGACHACSYIARQRGRAFSVVADYMGDKRYCSIYSLITTGDMFGAKMLYEIIPKELNPIDREAFRQNHTQFYACVTNCETGKSEYPQIKDVFDDSKYVRASSSMPLISRMVEINGNKYLDGAITDSIPVVEAMRLGCEVAVVVLTRPSGYRKEDERLLGLMCRKYRAYPRLVEAMKNRAVMYNSTLEMIERYEKKGKLFVIRPDQELDIGRTEKDRTKLKTAYDLGYKKAESLCGALKSYLS